MELHVELGTGWKYQELPSTALLTFVKSEKKKQNNAIKNCNLLSEKRCVCKGLH